MTTPRIDFLRQRVQVNFYFLWADFPQNSPNPKDSPVEPLSGSKSHDLILPFEEGDIYGGQVTFLRVADLLFSSTLNVDMPH